MFDRLRHKYSQTTNSISRIIGDIQAFISDRRSVEITRRTIQREFIATHEWTIKQSNAFLRPPGIIVGNEPIQGIALINDNVSKDPVLDGAFDNRKHSILHRDWYLEAGGDSDQDQEAKMFVKYVLDNMDDTFLGSMHASLDAVNAGFSIQEEVWSLIDEGDWKGKYRLKALKDKDQEKIRFNPDRFGNLDENNGIHYMDKWGNLLETYPPGRFFLFVFQKRKDSHYGNGLGFKLAWNVFFKKVAFRSYNIFLQRFGNPIVEGIYPDGTPDDVVDDFENAIDNLTEHNTITHPRGPERMEFELNLKEVGRAGDAGYVNFFDYLDRSIARRINGGTLTSDAGKKGSRSLGQIHNEQGNKIAKLDGLQLQDAFSKQTIARIVGVNYPSDVNPPKLKWRICDSITRKDILEIIAMANDVGMDVPEHWAYDQAQMEKPGEDDTLLKPRNKNPISKTGPPPEGQEAVQEIAAAQKFGEIGDARLSRPLTPWEEYADLPGQAIIIRQIAHAGARMGAEAATKVRDSMLSKVSSQYISRRGRIKSASGSFRVTADVSPIKAALADTQLTAYLQGSLTATENLERLGYRFPTSSFSKFESEAPISFDPSTTPRTLIPTQAQTLKGFSGRVPLSSNQFTDVQNEIKQRSHMISADFKRVIESRCADCLMSSFGSKSVTGDSLINTIKSKLMPFTGSEELSEDPLVTDAVETATAFRQAAWDAFNQGRYAIFKRATTFVGGLSISSAMNSLVVPVSHANDRRVYAIDDERWTWLLPPTDRGDRSTIIPVPVSSFSPDDPPNEDPRPDSTRATLVA